MGTNYIPESISAGLDTTSTLNTNLTNIQTSLSRMLNINGDSTVGSNSMEIDLDMNSKRAINVADGVNNTDAVNLRQMNALINGNATGIFATQVESQLGSGADGSNKFTLAAVTYSPGSNNIRVLQNGQELEKTVDYTETSATEITLTFDPNDLDRFKFVVGTPVGNNVQDAASVTYTPGGAGVVSTNVQDKLRELISVTDFGALGDGVTDDTVEIQAAIDAASAAGGGTVFFPSTSNSYLISSSLTMALKVNLIGEGDSSKITCDDCDGLNFAALTTGFGSIIVDRLHLVGTNGTTRKAIVHSGTETATDELYGLTITNNLITDFNEAISFRTVRNFLIDNNWIQNVNSGIVIEGRNIVGRIINNNIVRASGNGTGNDNGIFLNDHNYTTSGGVVRPEGIVISNNFIGTFNQALNIDDAVFCSITDNDIAAHIQGISFSTVSGTLSIRGNYINMDDDTPGTSLYGIFGEPQNSILSSVVINIDGNTVVGADTTSCAGVQLATAVTANQANINIINNAFYSLDTNDIVTYSSGNINIKGNQCYSANTTSIMVKATLAGRPITIDDNYCIGDIRAPFADTQHAQVLLGNNTGTFSTAVKGTTIITNPSTSATTTYASLRPGGTSDIPSFSTSGGTALGFEIIPVIHSHNVNAVGNVSATATATGITITLETTPASNVEIHWEVIMRQKYS